MSDPILAPHYVRFARSLALSASLVLPACGSTAQEPPSVSPPAPAVSENAPSSTEAHANTPSDQAAAKPTPEPFSVSVASPEDAGIVVAEAGEGDAASTEPSLNPYALDASADAARPFHSGPLPPPELPHGMA
jgi:hypothetical protein